VLEDCLAFSRFISNCFNQASSSKVWDEPFEIIRSDAKVIMKILIMP
jgi:hypothetical protein